MPSAFSATGHSSTCLPSPANAFAVALCPLWQSLVQGAVWTSPLHEPVALRLFVKARNQCHLDEEPFLNPNMLSPLVTSIDCQSGAEPASGNPLINAERTQPSIFRSLWKLWSTCERADWPARACCSALVSLTPPSVPAVVVSV